MQISHAATANHLLASLPGPSLERLRPRLTFVTLALRQPLYDPDSAIEAVYFPLSGMISLVANLEDGTQAEVGIIGQEGVLGTSLLSGVDSSFIEAMTQIPGTALRLPAKDFRNEMEENRPFMVLVLRFNEALQAQIMQTAACNGRHGLKQRLARWLLMAHDRSGGDTLQLTQEFMAMMLGTHRASVTGTAKSFQKAGLIRYSGGRIDIIDRPGLEAASCDCYAVVQRRLSLLVGKPRG